MEVKRSSWGSIALREVSSVIPFTPFYLYLYNRLRSTWYAACNIVENSAPSARYSTAMLIFTSKFIFGAVEKSLRLVDDIVCCHAE
jgi:hypothetical protein